MTTSTTSTATISEAKNALSALLRKVHAGETIIITNRKQPVATLAPIQSADAREEDDRSAALIRAGVVRMPSLPPDPSLADGVLELLSPGVTLSDAVAAEREGGW